MIFPDGQRKAGFFEFNVFKRQLTRISEFDKLKFSEEIKFPKEFREELEEYLNEIKIES